jgi:hypothetical protein
VIRDDFLARLRQDRPGLAVVVARAAQRNRRWVIVTDAAGAAWEQREPAAWARVQGWLAAECTRMIRVSGTDGAG